MNLEIKHLAPYLPYGLKIEHPTMMSGGRKISEMRNLGQTSIEISHRIYVQISSCKPLLRPLSDYADINSDAMNSLNCDMSEQIQISEFASKRISLSSVSVGAFDVLVSNHVDVFGLIDQGLALPLI